MSYQLDNWMVGWTPKDWPADLGVGGEVKVSLHPDLSGWSDRYAYTAGNCWLAQRKWPRDKQVVQMLLEFNHMVVRDEIDPLKAHREFLKIDAYRELMAEDMPK